MVVFDLYFSNDYWYCHFFMYLFAIYMSLLEKCLFKSRVYFVSSYYWDTKDLSIYEYFQKIKSLTYDIIFPFHFLEDDILFLMTPYFSFVAHAFVVIIKKPLSNTRDNGTRKGKGDMVNICFITMCQSMVRDLAQR